MSQQLEVNERWIKSPVDSGILYINKESPCNQISVLQKENGWFASFPLKRSEWAYSKKVNTLDEGVMYLNSVLDYILKDV